MFLTSHNPSHNNQGVHTMAPVSWQVSVLLALILSGAHLTYRITANFGEYPPSFVQQVGECQLAFVTHKQMNPN